MDKVEAGDNVAYVLGKVEAMHKCVAVSPDEIVVKSLVDQGTRLVSADMYLGRQVLVVPGVGEGIREIVKYRWIVIVGAMALIVAGCIPRKAEKMKPDQKDESQKVATQST